LNDSESNGSDSEEDYDQHPEARQMRDQCLKLTDALNNRFYRYNSVFEKPTTQPGQERSLLEPARPQKMPKAMQILQGITDQQIQSVFKKKQDQYKSYC
jgi:hypothetical protein